MIRLPFFWRLYASFVLIIILLATLTSVVGARSVRANAVRSLQDTLLDESQLLRHLVDANSFAHVDGLQELVQDLGERVNVRITLIAPDGSVWADTETDASRMDNHGERPEILQAASEGVGLNVRHSDTLNREMMYAAIAVREGDELLGYVRSALPLQLVEARIASFQRSLVLATAIAATIAVLGAWFFARKVTQPLRSMTLAVQSIEAGNYEHNLHAQSRDEIGALAVAFNRMSHRLRQHVATIEADRNKIFAILSSMSEAVIAIDGNERILHINSAAGEMFQADVSTAMGRPVQEVLRRHELREALRRALQTGQGEQSELRIRRVLRDQVIKLHSSVLLDNQGARVGALLVLSDASELRRLESIRTDFVSNVSHEMKTPVAAIKGLVESILDDPEMGNAVRSNFLHRIQQQCVRLSNLVTDLLGLAAAERGASVDLQEIELNGVCRQCARDHRDGASERGLELTVQIPGESIEAMADSEAVRLILDNLLTNAIRYTPEGGEISVRLASLDGHAVMEVQDTGIGIEPTHQERIFERFYRVDKARSRELGGTGLGLAIVKHLVNAMNGEIELESSPGAGSLFRVKLPLAS